MAADELHLDRGRAESFGSVAEQYDRYRLPYPDALMDDLAALRPAAVLDAGCGTGKAAAALARRGLSVLGVEPDERMAAVARGHAIPVEVAAFETWDDAGRRFDLITCGQAWHWIDPELGVAKAATVLRPGGTIARFWNYHVLDEPVIAALEEVYRQHAPQADPHAHAPRESGELDALETSDAFRSPERRTYRWERTLSGDEWAALVATFSDHRRIEPTRLAALQGALHATITRLGGAIRLHGGTVVRLARRA